MKSCNFLCKFISNGQFSGFFNVSAKINNQYFCYFFKKKVQKLNLYELFISQKI